MYRIVLVLLAINFISFCHAETLKTTVAILGGGMAGVTAADTLFKNGITDFLIIEAESVIGGRMKEMQFGGYTIELGANWIQGIRNDQTGDENPVWTLAKKHQLITKRTDTKDILTFDQNGWVNYSDIVNRAFHSFDQVVEDAIKMQTLKSKDVSFAEGQRRHKWKPETPYEQVADWWAFDFEYADTPATTSMFHVANHDIATYGQWSHDNRLVIDRRGYATIVRNEANGFAADKNILYNSTVSTITYSNNSVKIELKNGVTILAEYAICTFSLGVLQHNDVTFIPTFPAWKQESIFKFKMTVYTKIFLQFPYKFWNDTLYFLYADSHRRGYYPQWQSLSEIGFFPGSNIIFVTVVTDESFIVESQSDHQTRADIMKVLRSMYQTDIPDPINFHYHRWTLDPLYRGSYMGWPVGTSLCQHENLRRPIGRLYFAGEAYSQKYFGYVHGAYYEGLETGNVIVQHVLNGISDPDMSTTTISTTGLSYQLYKDLNSCLASCECVDNEI